MKTGTVVAASALILASCASTLGKNDDLSVSSAQVYLTDRCPIENGIRPPTLQSSQSSKIGSAIFGPTEMRGSAVSASGLGNIQGDTITIRSAGRLFNLIEDHADQPYLQNMIQGANLTQIEGVAQAEQIATALQPVDLHVAARLNCVLVVVGQFDPAAPLSNSAQMQFKYNQNGMVDFAKHPHPSRELVYTHLSAAGLHLSEPPDLVYEGRVAFSGHGDAFWLESTFLHVGDYLSKNTLEHNARRMLIQFSIVSPQQNAKAYTLRALHMVFGEVEKGRTYLRGHFPSGGRSSLIQSFVQDANAIETRDSLTRYYGLIKSTKAELDARRKSLIRLQALNRYGNSGRDIDLAVTATQNRIVSLEHDLSQQVGEYIHNTTNSNAFMPVELKANVVEVGKLKKVVQLVSNILTKSSPPSGLGNDDDLQDDDTQISNQGAIDQALALENALTQTRIQYLKQKQALANRSAGTDPYASLITEEAFMDALNQYTRVLIQMGSPAVDE